MALSLTYLTKSDLRAAGISYGTYTKPAACSRCGGNGWFPTPQHGACFRCGGAKVDPTRKDEFFTFADAEVEAKVAAMEAAASKAVYDANVAAAAAAEVAAKAEMDARWDKWRAAFPAFFETYGRGVKVSEVANIAMALINCGADVDGTDRNSRDARSKVEMLDKRLAEDAAKVAAGVACPTGRLLVEGTIASTKEVSGPFGISTKCLVVADAGWKVWGSLPAGCAKGDKVRFTATIETKGDPLFGFYKRPTKVEVLAAAAAHAEGA